MMVSDRFMRRVKAWMFRHVHGMITCAEFETFIVDYLEGGLGPAQQRIFELHLRICRECRDYLEAYRRAVAMGKAVFDDGDAVVPADVPEDMVKAIMAARAVDE